MNTVTWDFLDMLDQLIVYTLAETSALVNIFTCTQAKRVFHPWRHMRQVMHEPKIISEAVSSGHPGARND